MKKNSIILIFIVASSMLLSMKNSRTSKHLPVLIFKANSLAFDSIQDYDDTYKGMDSIAMIMNVVNVIKSDSHLKMIIEGFYDSKETVKDLGLKRAEKVRRILTENGVSDTIVRIKARIGNNDGYTNKKVNAMSKSDEEFIRRRNRMVVFELAKW